ncbi:DUF2533 family protein [Paenibacillus thalictri]|uniref:DUF2533 family protein n=2 Tax=Paenibacillus thalictri TaxID=2527873 RepID=A0A4Q9DSG2_9BACL|nr:DUF2533 family protein [Paenibacillus thalictri]TBL78714.1 DUF2533 family protein [Paenibacillus thalictri]
MDVRQAITDHTKKMNQHLEQFVELDALREQAIEKAIASCKAGQPFTVDEINRYTQLINEHAKQGISPLRKFVSAQMVEEFASR